MLPIRFEYFDPELEELTYISILHQFKHHFTGETMYKIRVECQSGFVIETFLSEGDLFKMIEESKNQKE